MIDEMRRRYADFLQRNPYLAQATCWTVVQPVTTPLSVGAIAERLGGRVEDLEYEPDDDVDEADYEGAFYISQDGASFIVYEDNGYQGTRPEVLRRLSDGARVVSLFWNVNANTKLQAAAVPVSALTALRGMSPLVQALTCSTLCDYRWHNRAMAMPEPADTTVKKSVTLRRSLAEEIESRTGPRGFSRFVDQAAEYGLALLKAEEIVADHERRIGPLSDETMQQARRAWSGE